MRTAIIVFARTPEPGKVKTRLARVTGEPFALEAYQALLHYTFSVLHEIGHDVHVFYTPAPIDGCAFRQHPQLGNDLGEKLLRASLQIFSMDYSRVVFIGTDCPGLNRSHLESAFIHLEKTNIVIGPAMDGGYYLIGMDKHYPELFMNMPWSTDKLCRATHDTADKLRLSVSELEPLRDIDEWEDLVPYLTLLNLPDIDISGNH